jgi:plastocyanin
VTGRVVRRAAVALLAIAAVACARRVPRAHEVVMRDLAFQPTVLTVAQGDTVVWRNADILPHTATAVDTTWDSKTIAANGEWRWVARMPGRRAYYCVFHPNMKGEVDVR